MLEKIFYKEINVIQFKDSEHVINKNIYSLKQIELSMNKSSVKLGKGGISLSTENHNCQSNINIAIIIPYRDRFSNLKVFLKNMHPYLTRQKINYQFILIEPVENVTFNRGILMNIGFNEALKDNQLNRHLKWNCFFFHGKLYSLIKKSLTTLT